MSHCELQASQDYMPNEELAEIVEYDDEMGTGQLAINVLLSI